MFHDLVEKGIITEIPSVNAIRASWAYGYLYELLGKDEVKGASMEELFDLARKVRLSETERAAVKHAQERAGVHITAIGDSIKQSISQTISETNTAFNNAPYLQQIKDVAAEGMFRRQSRNEVVTAMQNATGDTTRDMHRVAHTEMQDARIKGHAQTIIEKKGIHTTGDGIDSVVFRRPLPGACADCIRLYLGSDGITPRLYTLRELAGNGTNFGISNRLDWKPVIGATHPYCSCTFHRMPRDRKLEKELGKKLKRDPVVHEVMAEMEKRRFDPHGKVVGAKAVEAVA